MCSPGICLNLPAKLPSLRLLGRLASSDMAASSQLPQDWEVTYSLAGENSSSAVVFHLLLCDSLKNIYKSLQWLAVRMCCAFVLDLMPHLSYNGCTGWRGKRKWMERRAGLHSLLLRWHSLSQQEPYEAAVWLWHFVNVSSEICQSPWFNVACCSSSSSGAYIKSVTGIEGM